MEITLETVMSNGGNIVVRNLPAHEYHSVAAISSSLLKGYAALPSTCKRPYIPKDDAAVGSGCHAFTLQNEAALFDECAIMPPECQGKGKAATLARELFATENLHKSHLPAEYSGLPIMEVIRNADTALRNHPSVGPILADSEKELSLFWVEEVMDQPVLCKARLDIWQAKTRQVWDLKKTSKFDGFSWQIKELNYGLQGAFYMMGAEACGLQPLTFGLIPFESAEPWRVGIGYLRDNPSDEGRLEMAKFEAQRLLCLLVESTAKGDFPNYRLPSHVMSLADVTGADLITTWDVWPGGEK